MSPDWTSKHERAPAACRHAGGLPHPQIAVPVLYLDLGFRAFLDYSAKGFAPKSLTCARAARTNPTLSAISKYLIKKTIHFDRRRHVRVSYVTASNCHNSAVRSKTRHKMDAERHRPADSGLITTPPHSGLFSAIPSRTYGQTGLHRRRPLPRTLRPSGYRRRPSSPSGPLPSGYC